MEEKSSKIIEYEFNLGYRVPWLEGILKEFKIETKESWQKLDSDTDWFASSCVFHEPTYPEFYSITYTCLPEISNPNHEFAESLIESLLSYVGYLEGCLLKEIKEDNSGDI